MAGEQQRSRRAWRKHPLAAFWVRSVAWITPILVSVLATLLVSRAVGRPSGWLAVVGWWTVMIVVATVMLVVTDKLARRLLPLAALLRLSLVFPDQAPSRFRVALRTSTVHQLEQRVAAVKQSGLPSDPTDAAETLIELVAALSAHDRLTRGHAERVRAYSWMIGEEMRLGEADLERLHWAGLLHDVGKLFVPGEILNKPGALTPDEFEVVKLHPGLGAVLCEPLRPWLGDWVDAVGQHHERWDGQGYPSGLGRRDISLAGRIVAVADAFDVMTSARSYKAPQDAASARAELARCAGSQFDPDVVRAFLGLSLGRLRLVMGPLSWMAQAPVVGRVPIAPAAGAAVSGVAAAVTLVAGGLFDHAHSDSDHVAAEAPAAEAPATVPPPTLVVEVPAFNGGRADDVPSSSSPHADRPAAGRHPVARSEQTTPSVPRTTPPAETTSPASSTTVAPSGVGQPRGSTRTTTTVATVTTTVRTTPTTAPTTAATPTTAAPATGGGVPAATPTAPPTSPTPPTTVAPATTIAAPVPTGGTGFYLGAAGSSADDFSFVDTPLPATATEPDHDGDGKPGLTVEKSDQKLATTDGRKFQHWDRVASEPMVLSGPVTLELWSTAKDFHEKDDLDYSIWLLDCAPDGLDCVVLASTVDVHVSEWNGGVKDWVLRTIPVGVADHTVQPGRMLRLRLMFNHHDAWIALSGNRPSRLLVTIAG
jgi:HD domain